MLDFAPNFTEVIYLDVESYVPNEDRVEKHSSMLANPTKPNHFLLGGVFCRDFPLLRKTSEMKHIWNWKPDDEFATLRLIYAYFKESWDLLKGKTQDHPDLIVMGIGVSRFDIPALFIRSFLKEIDTTEKLYDVYYKTKIVDLGDVGIPLFDRNQAAVLYPKTANSLCGRLGIQTSKASGRNVWDMFDSNDFDGIRKRTDNEVRVAMSIASRIVGRIQSPSNPR